MKKMSLHIRSVFFFFALCCFLQRSYAQQDPEFPKGFVMYAKLHSGMITDFTSYPDLFIGGLQVAPQYTVVPHLLRAGLIAGSFYEGKKIQGEFGTTVSLKIRTLKASLRGAAVGSIGNINLQLNHLWGTNKQRLFGGAINFDAGLITIGISANRDYNWKTWWFQSEIGIRISKKHKNPDI